MIQELNVARLKSLEAKYADILKIHKALAVSTKRYGVALVDTSIDHETKDARRDSVIKRFDLAWDLLCKYMRDYMCIVHNVEVDVSLKMFQQYLIIGIITSVDMEKLVEVMACRRLTDYVYDEDLANRVAADIQKHHDVIATIIKKVSLDRVEK